MSWNAQIIQKWLPNEILDQKDLFDMCKNLDFTCGLLRKRLEVLINNLKSNPCSKFNPLINDNDLQLTDIEDITLTLESIEKSYKKILPNLMKSSKKSNGLEERKYKMWRAILWKSQQKLAYFIQEIINEITHLFIYYGECLLIQTLRISICYNYLLDLDKKYAASNDNSICKNTCPYLMFPMRRISITRLLQIIAHKRAELCCHKLIDCLLETYKMYENSEDDDGSDNSSLEIYMTLTKHMSPPDVPGHVLLNDPSVHINDSSSFASIEELIYYEEKNIIDLLNVTLKAAPDMLGIEGVTKSKKLGTKISQKAREKVLEYYEQILWGEVGNFLEHIVLWWSSSPLSARPPHSSQHLREWIVQFIPTADVSPVVLASLANLADALGVHVASTSWDQHFRLALVASKTTCNRETGELFAATLQELVMLCNQCETTPDWFIGAPLDELPLVEQIPVLHRLDHSIHTTRLWAINECKKIVNNWNVKAFFVVIHDDIVNCVNQLNNLRLANQASEIEKKNLGVHVEVCALMRAKLVSEVKVNFDKLKEAPKECVDGLAIVCRTICLANLQMIFPPNFHWKKVISTDLISDKPNSFVDKYLDQILVPVLEATDDHLIANMILTLICESWLDHIYVNKIKFSHSGAYQLLCDFGYILTWLTEFDIKEPMRKKLLKNEVLKRCEGVGRLLLRKPGERIKMTNKSKKPPPTKSIEDSPEDEETGELMPAEMYVPNQEQWLELRAVKKKTSFPIPVCCGQP